MTYNQAVEYLYSSTPVFEHVGASAYKEGLSNTIALDNHFGHPHTAYKTIHVAGTNGKGSCSHTLASILQAQGYKVGLYTSPHLVDFRERIRVNGQMISEQRVIEFIEKERSFFEPLHPSFFELTTALALLYFKEQHVDIAVIEVGLGGRLDCTNIIHPIVSVITNISMDHTQFLGNTLAKIASEKAGIIKKGVPVVIGETTAETKPVFLQKAETEGTPIVFAEEHQEVMSSSETANAGRLYLTKSFGEIDGELGGTYQEKNTNTVLNVIKTINDRKLLPEISNEAVRQGFAQVVEATGLMGRWQIIHKSPLAICDTGHNVGGWQYLSKQIKNRQCHQKRIVFGMVDDKDVNAIMSMMPRDAVFYWTQPKCKRAFSVEQIAAAAKAHQLEGKMFKDVPAAYQAALKDAESDDFIFVGGSSYVVADLLEAIL